MSLQIFIVLQNPPSALGYAEWRPPYSSLVFMKPLIMTKASRAEARAWFGKWLPCKRWDERPMDLFIAHGLGALPTAAVSTLTYTREEETAGYIYVQWVQQPCTPVGATWRSAEKLAPAPEEADAEAELGNELLCTEEADGLGTTLHPTGVADERATALLWSGNAEAELGTELLSTEDAAEDVLGAELACPRDADGVATALVCPKDAGTDELATKLIGPEDVGVSALLCETTEDGADETGMFETLEGMGAGNEKEETEAEIIEPEDRPETGGGSAEDDPEGRNDIPDGRAVEVTVTVVVVAEYDATVEIFADGEGSREDGTSMGPTGLGIGHDAPLPSRLTKKSQP
ncbi:hypothetical protein DFH07DRAFT_954480 [Mycena maculata]|uniref:Uncharacterized protein n=1 Tax=Mycena maculata TaxID=230809 RepID=A0AAD7JSI7_9AGAR|nr:hypothetical protein DFH07DRAFT_954480 [Mycena maculata]